MVQHRQRGTGTTRVSAYRTDSNNNNNQRSSGRGRNSNSIEEEEEEEDMMDLNSPPPPPAPPNPAMRTQSLSSSSSPPPSSSMPSLLVRMSKSIALSAEMFATVGETVCGDDGDGGGGAAGGQDGEVAAAGRESRSAGSGLEEFCEALAAAGADAPHSLIVDGGGGAEPSVVQVSLSPTDSQTMVRVLRRLVAAVTRILLMADSAVVKQLLRGPLSPPRPTEPPDPTAAALQPPALSSPEQRASSMEAMHHFTEFSKAFCDFGTDVLRFLQILGDDVVNRGRHERRRAQVDCARLVLERSAALLLTSTKCLQCRTDLQSAKENRDAVFCQMRRALDLIHYIITEGVGDCGTAKRGFGLGLDLGPFMTPERDDSAASEVTTTTTTTILRSIHYLEECVGILASGGGPMMGDGYAEQLCPCLDSIEENTQDFTDSAYTSNARRQNIVRHCDRSRSELARLLVCLEVEAARAMGMEENNGGQMLDISAHSVEDAARSLLKAVMGLKMELQQTAFELSQAMARHCGMGKDILRALKDAAMSRDEERLQFRTQQFIEHIDYLEDVSKLMRHMTLSESTQIRAKHAQINLRIYGPQVCVAAKTLCHSDGAEQVAKGNLDAFCGMWSTIVEDVIIGTQTTQRQWQQVVGPMGLNRDDIMLCPLPAAAAPLIMKQPPTPGERDPSLLFQGHPRQHIHRLSVPLPTMASSSVSPSGQPIIEDSDKLNKSAPNLSHHFMPSPSLHRHHGNFFDPNMALSPPHHPREPRRHSTSELPPAAQYPPPYYQLQQQQLHRMLAPHMSHPGTQRAPLLHPPLQPQQQQQQHQLLQQQQQLLYNQQYQPRHSSNGSPWEVLNSYRDMENNEIVRRAKKMVWQANDMYDFVRGRSWRVRTTQDLFTLGEYLCEESNCLYKMIRLFSYDVPTGEDKRALMALADHLPKHCQRLQSIVQTKPVGKAATFHKVDSLVRATRHLIELVVRVVEACFLNGQRYNLDFSNIALPDSTTTNHTDPYGDPS